MSNVTIRITRKGASAAQKADLTRRISALVAQMPGNPAPTVIFNDDVAPRR